MKQILLQILIIDKNINGIPNRSVIFEKQSVPNSTSLEATTSISTGNLGSSGNRQDHVY